MLKRMDSQARLRGNTLNLLSGPFCLFGHLVLHLLPLFLATTAAAVRNKSEEGWEARALDRREAERLHGLLGVEESFAAAALDKA